MTTTKNKKFESRLDADHVVVSISSGKDSTILMHLAAQWQKEMPNTKFHYVHALIDIDWTITPEIVKAQCKHFGVKPNFVQAVDMKGKIKGILDHLISPKKNRILAKKAKEMRKELDLIQDADAYRELARELEQVEKDMMGEQMVPSSEARWCTTIAKIGPINKFAKKLRGNVLVLIGERWEEGEGNSSKRDELVEWRPEPSMDLKNGSRKVVKMSPILAMKETEVWSIIKENNYPEHPCYSWGVSRASCGICIFSSNKEIAICAQKDPQIAIDWIKAEAKISTSFKWASPSKKNPKGLQISIADILESEGVDVAALMATDGQHGQKKAA